MGTVYTVGHSTRSTEELVNLLREHGVRRLVDVRRYPASRRHPHFGKDELAASLGKVGVEYVHIPEMGGRRTASAESPNTAWRSAGVRAYADHMATPEFRAALERLIERAEEQPTAMMCAEAVPWRCHRQLISDVLVAGGHKVVHILGPGRSQGHELNADARVRDDGTLVYPAPEDDQRDLELGGTSS